VRAWPALWALTQGFGSPAGTSTATTRGMALAYDHDDAASRGSSAFSRREQVLPRRGAGPSPSITAPAWLGVQDGGSSPLRRPLELAGLQGKGSKGPRSAPFGGEDGLVWRRAAGLQGANQASPRSPRLNRGVANGTRWPIAPSVRIAKPLLAWAAPTGTNQEGGEGVARTHRQRG
jgi:hypothetical protein